LVVAGYELVRFGVDGRWELEARLTVQVLKSVGPYVSGRIQYSYNFNRHLSVQIEKSTSDCMCNSERPSYPVSVMLSHASLYEVMALPKLKLEVHGVERVLLKLTFVFVQICG
jgi:hypothetical protein